MKKIICVALAVLTFNFVLSGQSKEIYTHPDFDSISRDHKTLAILPFDVTLRLRPKEMKKLEPEDLKKMEVAEGKAVQHALQAYFLKQKDSCKVSFQDITKTNALLAEVGWSADSLRLKNKINICRQLQIDGIITGTVFTKKPMSDEVAATLHTLDIIASIITLSPAWGGGGKTNSGTCTVNVYEAKAGELLWKYEKTLSRGLGSDTQSVINAMMRKASKRFPYEDIK